MALILAKKMKKFYTIPLKDAIVLDWLKLEEHGAIVAGGAALRWYQGKTVDTADIDIFFKSSRDFDSMRRHIESIPVNGVLAPFTINDILPK